MGAIASKSPLERRNTVARRSQRRSIHSVKAKVDKIFQNIKKFKGTSEDDPNYKLFQSELEHTKTDLLRKSKDLQPQLRNIHEGTVSRIEDAFNLLDEKLRENQEKMRRKEQENQEKAAKKEKKNKEEAEDANDDVEVKEIEEEQNVEAENLEQTTEKRKTVELKFVQIVPDEVIQADVHDEKNNNVAKSPEDTRKSILKVGGVAVMPGALMNEISARSSTTKAHFENDSDNTVAKVNGIIEQLQAMEYQIADFVGKKYGTQYNRIRDRLQYYLDELNQFQTTDDYSLEQIKICRNYVGSCFNFLDEKSVDEPSVTLPDDVFLPPNGDPRSKINSPTSVSPPPVSSLSPVDARAKFQRLSKTTAI